MEKGSVEEFIGYFDKNDLENRFLQIENALTQNKEEKKELVTAMFRTIHSLKGTTAILKIELLNKFLHQYEDALGVISKNINSLVGVKKLEVFDFFLQGLDLVERVSLALFEDQEMVIKNNKELFNFYIKVIVGARELVMHQDQYFEFVDIDEDLF
ncbi:MAG: Hpt domain-containing protein [SAR324 cluster bacterium]|nr:Hpt domain-containing protein [SAR324 cluster bacterium]